MELTYPIFYVEANVVCLIIFVMMLTRSLRGVDQQTKQRFFNIVLACHIMYFICDSFWVLILYDYLPKNRFSTSLVNCGNAIILLSICCLWFVYVEMDQKATYIENDRKRLLVQIPAIFFAIVNVVLFIFFPSLMLDENYNTTFFCTIMFALVPILYIVVAVFKSLYRALHTDEPAMKKRCLITMFYGIGLIIFGIIQTSDVQIPLFCFGCTITMLYMYLSSLDDLVSLDPLTSLNNRAQLNRYVYQELQHSSDSNDHFVIMIDLNDFKSINDVHGHIEGDRALIKTAEIIKLVCGKDPHRPFIARYGGDEFILIVRSDKEDDIKRLADNLRKAFIEYDSRSEKPYQLSASIGYAPFSDSFRSFLHAVEEADSNLYHDKKIFYENKERSS